MNFHSESPARMVAGALAHLAANAGLPVHGAGQTGDDRQAQAGAAQLGAVAGVGLDEGLEDPGAGFLRDARQVIVSAEDVDDVRNDGQVGQ